jgi:hypothetical protein
MKYSVDTDPFSLVAEKGKLFIKIKKGYNCTLTEITTIVNDYRSSFKTVIIEPLDKRQDLIKNLRLIYKNVELFQKEGIVIILSSTNSFSSNI